MAQKVFLNDKIIDIEDAGISPLDSGFLYGAGVFETMVVFNGRVFALDKHLERLFNSLEALKFPVNFDHDFLENAIYKTIRANELVNARMRLTVTNGLMSFTKDPKPTLLITAGIYQGYPEEFYENGVLVVLSDSRQDSTSKIAMHKTTNYLPRLMEMNIARSKGAAESLWFTAEGILAEGCMSNVFLVKDSKLYTPTLETPILGGVARSEICRLSREAGIEVVEKNLIIKDLLEADEVFLSNVVMRVLPVTSVEKHDIGSGNVGELTGKISKLYLDNLAEKCGFKEASSDES